MSRSLPVFVINGPNLNMLGTREPSVYGSATLEDIESLCRDTAAALGLSVECRQSNHEGEIVGWIQEAASKACGILVNAGAYTHTSVAIHDALRLCGLPIIEVHISNVFAREEFRHRSFVSAVASGVICGLGINGYALALRGMSGLLADNSMKNKK